MITSHSYDEQLEGVIAFIERYNSFLVVAHEQPDGDAISSCSAMTWLLEQYNKQVIIINESELPGRLSYLYQYDNIKRFNRDDSLQFDAVIALDCADYSRLGEVRTLFTAEITPLLNIDHHPTNNEFGTLNIVRSHAAATVEIIYDLIKYANLTPNLPCAIALYTGLLTDTGGFRYSNTSPEVMAMASELLALGVSAYELADHLLEKMTYARLRLLQTLLARISFSSDHRIGWVSVMRDDLATCGAVPEDLEGIVNYVLNVDSVEVGILFKESESGFVKASIRSAGKVDVAAIAHSFGGGGHVRAAGCKLNADMNSSIEDLVGAIRKALT